MQLDYLEFPVSNLKSSRDFYGAAFGWTFTEYGPDYLAFHDPALEGGFRRVDGAVSTGGVLVCFRHNPVEEAKDRVLAAGGRLTVDIFAFPGGRRFQFLDPDGHELAVWGT